MIEGIENMDNSTDKKSIQINCPICGTEKTLKISTSLIKQSKTLTTISIPKHFICEHHFQAFVDKDFRVRGYQKVDFEFSLEEKKRDAKKNSSEQVIVSSTKYPNKNEKFTSNNFGKSDFKSKEKEEMTLKEVYDKYWHLIENDSKTFHKFIKDDKRRKK